MSEGRREEKRRAARERKNAIEQQELSIEREREQEAFKALQESRQKLRRLFPCAIHVQSSSALSSV